VSVRASLDSNILVYAALEPASDKGKAAAELIGRAAPRGVLATQALLEFVAVVRRRAPNLTNQAIAQAEAWAQVFETAPTTLPVMRAALGLVAAHRFQVWDAVIWAASRDVGATVLFTEDLQDGYAAGGMVAVNPFTNSTAELARLIGAT
jgi:predicted nucleic acid-binding protein